MQISNNALAVLVLIIGFGCAIATYYALKNKSDIIVYKNKFIKWWLEPSSKKQTKQIPQPRQEPIPAPQPLQVYQPVQQVQPQPQFQQPWYPQYYQQPPPQQPIKNEKSASTIVVEVLMTLFIGYITNSVMWWMYGYVKIRW